MGHLFSRDYRGCPEFNEDISAWDTSSATTFTYMFFKADSFNQPISGWNVDKVTSMTDMFRGAKAFDQDLGWCLGDQVNFASAFEKTKCESTRCGFSYRDVIGNCERGRLCLIGTKGQCHINSPTLAFLLANILLALLASAEWYVHRRKKEDETYVVAARRLLCCRRCQSKMESSSVTSPRPDFPAESPRDEPDEEATAETTKATEAVERPGVARKLSSFLFGEQEGGPKEEEATAHSAAEAEDAPSTEQPPPPPAKRWFSREPPKAEEMHQRVGCWYTFAPEAAALRAAWGEYPGTSDALQAWPGFVQVTNAFLDANPSDPEA